MCILRFLCSLCCFPLQLSPSVLWYCWLGLLTCKNRLPYNLYCVGGDVKHCTIQSKLIQFQLESCRYTICSFLASTTRSAHCTAPNIDISLKSGWFWATSIASFRERLLDFKSCWIVFIHVAWGRPGGLFQFSKVKPLRSSGYLFHLAFTDFTQCGRTARHCMNATFHITPV